MLFSAFPEHCCVLKNKEFLPQPKTCYSVTGSVDKPFCRATLFSQRAEKNEANTIVATQFRFPKKTAISEFHPSQGSGIVPENVPENGLYEINTGSNNCVFSGTYRTYPAHGAHGFLFKLQQR